MGNAGAGQNLIHALHQLLPAGKDILEDGLGFQNFQCGCGGSGGDDIATVGSAMRHLARFDHGHDGVFAGNGGDREAVAHRLGIGGKVGLDAKIFLRAAAGNAEAGLDLIKDEDDAMLGRKGGADVAASPVWA